jgi:hypothetical protein
MGNNKFDEEISDNNIELTEEQKQYIKKMLERLIDLGIAVVYGDEPKDYNEVVFDEKECLDRCKAVCCSFTFALTKEEVTKGLIKWNKKKPYFIARDEDGYCPHLNRETLKCEIWNERPIRCRIYDCRNDKNVWIDWDNKVINPDIFKHLKK